VQVGPEDEGIFPVLLRPFERPPKAVLPEVDSPAEPVIFVRAGLKLSVAEQNGLAAFALAAVVSHDEAVVIGSV